MSGPFGLAFDRNGNLFVADKDTNAVFKYTVSGSKTLFASGLHIPTALAFDAGGNLFVADFGGNAVVKISPDGVQSTFASSLSNPSGLAFDAAGNLYESDYGSGTIQKFTVSGDKSLFAAGLGKPEAIVFDRAGNLFVPDFNGGFVYKFLSNGAKTTFATGLKGPWGLALDSSGNLFVAASAGGAVLKLETNGSSAIAEGGLGTPTFLAFERPSASLLNISTRMRVLTGENVLIGGFIVTGSDTKRVLLRGLGPSLSTSGISDVLLNPIIDLKDHSGATITTNDDWKQAQQAEIEQTGIPPKDDRESAVVASLPPGGYTAILSGNSSTSGVGLVELYDLAQGARASIANISTRGFVDTGTNVMIGGFISGGGDGSARVLVRSLGPSLTASGVANVLADPTLELHNADGAIISANDNWKDTQEPDIRASTIPPDNDLEAALVVTLAAGNYTAVVSGKNGGVGVALVEVFNLQ
ncbi:MAG: NHL repeat-containing protein [Chthoniobacterales bacterium]